MKNTLNIEPASVFHYFEELSKIPRGSGNTKAVSDFCVNFAKEHNLEYHQDSYNNCIIIKEASKGYEASSPIIIQGHLDMVCEKDPGVEIDFETEALQLYVEDDFLKAKGTTLGADDGIAVAFALAILDDDSIMHPRLECVFTIDEETTMEGAQTVDTSVLKGHTVLNIDSDVEGSFLTSSAGGTELNIILPTNQKEISGLCLDITLTGLRGGHSGAEIDKERANASSVMGRILKHLSETVDFNILNIYGGNKANAITREATASIIISNSDFEIVEAELRSFEATLKNEYYGVDDDIRIDLKKNTEGSYKALDRISTTKVIYLLRTIPFGVAHMSTNIPGLVETSSNIGIIKLEKDAFSMIISIRSSVSSRKDELVDRITFTAEFIGADVIKDDDYPAWEYNPKSELRTVIASTYSDLFNENARFEAIHAGLECGYFNMKIENMDAVSFGPNCFDIHTPQERLSIKSTQKYWKFLIELLKRLK